MSFIEKQLKKLAMKASGMKDEDIALAEDQQKNMARAQEAYKKGGDSAARESYFKDMGMNEEEINDVEAQQKNIEEAYKKGGDSAAREAYFQNTQKTMDRVMGTRETNCHQCGKPSSGGKFCNNCGASLTPKKCLKCGTNNSVVTKFCSECGTKLI